MRFSELNISCETVNALRHMSYHELTEVQEIVIPKILCGEEVIVRSQTGTGKTAAFGIGMVEAIAKDKSRKGLVLAPTRELALQITRELRAIGVGHRLRVITIYGGESIERQLRQLDHGFDIVIATPGRLLDHAQLRSIRLRDFNIIVLDEADRMLDMGFLDDIDSILQAVSKSRQMMLFSATVDEQILGISKKYMKTEEIIEVGPQEKVGSIKEESLEMPRRDKLAKLFEVITQHKNLKVLVFSATQRSAEYVADTLYRNGFKAKCLHGGMKQNKREKIVREYCESRFNVLVATDVAARGLHIDDIALVINYDEARDAETHLHRIGRTGRMGKEGRAITFIESDKNEREWLRDHGKARKRDRRKFDFIENKQEEQPSRILSWRERLEQARSTKRYVEHNNYRSHHNYKTNTTLDGKTQNSYRTKERNKTYGKGRDYRSM